MKLAFYIDSMQFGGANRVIANLVNHFIEDYDVILINDKKYSCAEYKIDPKVKRFFLDADGCLYKSFVAKQFIRIKKIRNILKNERCNVVISFMGPPNIRMICSTVGLNIKKIVSVRNDPYKEYGKGIHKYIIGLLFRLCDVCVFQTKIASDYFPKEVVRKSTIILNPINENFFIQERLPELNQIIMVGRLEAQKNIYLAIKSFSKIKNNHNTCKLIIYGEGTLKYELEKYVKKIGLENSIIFAGHLDKVEAKLASASIYLLTSNYEGLPNSLMEAMAVGVPCVSTNCPCGGPDELIKNGINGFLVECNNEQQLASVLELLLGDSDLRHKIGLEAKKRAEAFRSNKIYDQWNSLFIK